jgi:hypothetical protein
VAAFAGIVEGKPEGFDAVCALVEAEVTPRDALARAAELLCARAKRWAGTLTPP